MLSEMPRSQKFELTGVKSGVSSTDLWVSLGFSSPLERWDVLHIVCAKRFDDQDRELGMDSIYLERFDQAYSCYKAASRIRVHQRGVDLHLTKQGAKALDFAPILRLTYPQRQRGVQKAIRVFKQMTKYECGRIINVV